MSRIPSEFHSHSLRSTPKNPLSHERILRVCHAYRTLHDAFIAAGGQITSELYTTMLEIDREIIAWEHRSARLRYAARKQSEARAIAREQHNTPPRNYLGESDAEGGSNFTDHASEVPDDSSVIIPDATRAALAKYKTERAAPAPDNSAYKKSGLV